MSRYFKLLPRLAAWYAVHDPAQTGLFLLLLLSATLLPLLGAWWTAPEPTAAASFDLRALAASPNLDVSEPVLPSAPSVPPVPAVTAEIVPVSLNMLAPEPAPLELAGPVTLRVPPSHAGDTIMTRTWKLAGWPAILALTAAPLLAAEPADKNGNAELIKRLDSIQESLKQLTSKQGSDSLDQKNATDVLKGEVGRLKEEVGQLRKDIDSLKSQSTRTAFSPSTTTNPTGRIRLVNLFPEQMTVLVNDTAYRLQPGETRTLESQPAGQFLYQVLGAQTAPQPRLLAANEMFTVTVYPR